MYQMVMASVTLVMLSGDQCDTHYDTGKIDLAPRARRSVSTGSPTDTSSKTPCLSRLPAEPLGWNSPSANGVSDPRPILGVYEVSVEPIIGRPQGPKVHLWRDFAKLLQRNSSISFPVRKATVRSWMEPIERAPTQSYNVGRGHKAVCANFQQKVVFYQGGVWWKAVQFHFDRGSQGASSEKPEKKPCVHKCHVPSFHNHITLKMIFFAHILKRAKK